MKPTFGERATAALFALFDRAKTSGHARALARENIGPDMVALLDEMAQRARLERKVKATTPQRTAEMDEIWLAELEADPTYRGIDVRRELGKCQGHFKELGIVVSRMRFRKWLNRAEPNARAIAVNGYRQSSFSEKKQAAPAGWLARLNEQFAECVYARGGTFEIKEETDYHFGQLPDYLRKLLG